mmetsp:Transcript_36899/g.59105  ORF Transcript_36899/g.59105 Transcript_36899/m.59105 type:complete len:142 (+) Transcript_36899:849-1274(+)
MALLFHSIKRYLTASARTSSRLAQRMNRAQQDPVKITAAAADRIKDILKGATEQIDGVRLGVQKGGCNGLEYTMNYNDPSHAKSDDLAVEQHGVKLIVENRALFYMVGTTIDYKEDDLRAGFVFDNPNVAAKCGCEMSFSV